MRTEDTSSSGRRHLALEARTALALVTLFGAFQWSCGDVRVGVGAPNVVVVLIDTLRADHLGCYGYPRPTTPFLDELAQKGTLFAQAMSPASWTKPSIPSIFTGLYPIGHGVHTGNRSEGDEITSNVLSHDHLTLAEAFQDQGYATGAFIHNTQIASFLGFDQGFDVYREEVGKADQITSACLDWLGTISQGPFFAYVHYLDPHWPYTPPADFTAMFPSPPASIDFNDVNWKSFGRMVEAGEIEFSDADIDAMRALYDGEIRYTDAAIGRLLAGLESQGLTESTILVVTADHGEEFFEHGRLGHGESLYDEVLRVPLIFRVPGESPGRVESPVELVDIFPTLLEAADVTGPETVSGKSLLPLIRGERAAPSPTFGHHRPEGDAGPTLQSVRTRRLKLIRTFAPSAAAKQRARSRWKPPAIQTGQWLEVEGPVGSSGSILALEVEAIDPEEFMKISGPIQSMAPDADSFEILGRRCAMEDGAKIKNEEGERLRNFKLQDGMWVQARGVPNGSGGFTINRIKLLESKKEEEVVGPVTAVHGADDGFGFEMLGFLVEIEEGTDFENLAQSEAGEPGSDAAKSSGGRAVEPDVPRESRLQRVELYDLVQDPGETRDISEQNPNLVEELTTLLDAWEQQHGGAGERESIVLSTETIEKLRSLGYLQ